MSYMEVEVNDDIYIEEMFPAVSEQQSMVNGITVDQAEKILETMVDYKEMRMMYACAIKEVHTKFDVLNTEYSIRYQRNPINFITTRVKSTHSILEKMNRIKNRFTLKDVAECLNDIAGVRVICSYIDDIYRLAEALTAQDDIRLLEKKDYIQNPKPNGYRSLHLIVSVPVFFAEQRQELKVEVQIRTIAMDFWASLEHQIKYKKEIPDQAEIIARLKECADTIAKTDANMMEIRQHMEEFEEEDPESSLLLEKVRRLDVPII